MTKRSLLRFLVLSPPPSPDVFEAQFFLAGNLLASSVHPWRTNGVDQRIVRLVPQGSWRTRPIRGIGETMAEYVRERAEA